MAGDYPWYKSEYGDTKTWVLVSGVATIILAIVFWVAWFDARINKDKCDSVMKYAHTSQDSLRAQIACNSYF